MNSDRGAILIHAALGVLAMTAFLTFVADMGLMWVARGQAQNSADAGALAGATALAFDDSSDYTASGAAKLNAHLATQINLVWGQAPYVDIGTHITFPLVPAAQCDPDADGLSQCVKADVFRTMQYGNPLPMMFGHLVGLTTQNMRASATAMVQASNASDCIKPWGLADKWDEKGSPPWDPTDTFDPAVDDYRPQGENGPQDPGTGFKAPPATPNDYGTELTLKYGDPKDTIKPGWFQALDLHTAPDSTCTNGGADCYDDSIVGCAGGTWTIGDLVPIEMGDMRGKTDLAVWKRNSSNLIDLDPLASWDGTKIVNSCANTTNYTCSRPGYLVSPRVVAIPVFDLEHYLATGGPGQGAVKIVNILGFFVDHAAKGGEVTGYLINKTGITNPNGGTVAWQTSFLKQIVLIR